MILIALTALALATALTESEQPMRCASSPYEIPKWANHAFLGWYTEAEGGNRVTSNALVTLEAKRRLYAHWTDQQVTVFRGNGGTPNTKMTTNVIGTAYGPLPTPKWTNHVFLGWYTAAEDGQQVSSNTTVTQEAKRRLYAHWSPARTIGNEFAISGMQLGDTGESGHPAGARAVAPMARGEMCTIRFEASGGVEYEIQWAPSLLAGWISLEHLVAEDDGESEVEVELPADAPQGFFRILSSGRGADVED